MKNGSFVAEPDDFYRYYNSIAASTLTDADLANEHPWLKNLRQSWGVTPLPLQEVQRRVTAAYYGMVDHLDRQVASILEALEQSGIADNTIVIYTSDHGEQLGEHGLWWKSTFYEGSLGVPLIIADPRQNHEQHGRVIKENISLIDIGPTLLDLTQSDPLPQADGRSFRCLLEQPNEQIAEQWPNEVFAEYNQSGNHGSPQRMLKKGPWKFIYYHRMPPQLFHLENDPTEQNDLAQDPAYAEILSKLQAATLADWNPDELEKRLACIVKELRMVGQWAKQSNPPEQNSVWFKTIPKNDIEPIKP